jgi:hypothetical protein
MELCYHRYFVAVAGESRFAHAVARYFVLEPNVESVRPGRSIGIGCKSVAALARQYQ